MLLFKMHEAMMVGAFLTMYWTAQVLVGTMDDINTEEG